MNIILSLLFLVLSVVLTKTFCIFAKNTSLMDKPNERSLHVTPTIRGGGLVFISLSLLSLPLLSYLTQSSFVELYVLSIGMVLLAAISFMDDLYNLSAKTRFFVQCIVAALIAVFMNPDQLNFLLFSFTNQYVISVFLFFAVIWAINHFNFMDGIDGFCALQALFLSISYSLLFDTHDAQIYQYFCLTLSFSLLGFLIFNFPPAKLFMGDIGSATLGFISFSIAVIAQQKYQIPILYWFLLNGLFLFDSTITLIRRIIHKEKWSSPHRKHAYQRLKQLGIETRLILLGQTLLNISFLAGVLLLQYYTIALHVVLLFELVCLLFFYYLIEKRFPMFAVV